MQLEPGLTLSSQEPIRLSTERASEDHRRHAALSPDAQDHGRVWLLAVAILAMTGVGLVLLSTSKYGAGLSPDSVDYFDVARSLVSGKGFVFHTGEPLVWYPPLYPLLLSLAGWVTRLDPTAFAHVINAVLFAMVIFMSARLLRTEYGQTGIYRALGLCAVLFGRPLCSVYAMAWSECLFIPLVLIYLLSAQRYWNTHSRLSFAGMTLSTAFACLTRYLGATLVPAGILTIILAVRTNVRTRVVRTLTFAIISLVPIGIWAAQVYKWMGTPFWYRGPIEKTLLDNVVAGAKAALSLYAYGMTSKLVVLVGLGVLVVIFLSTRGARRKLACSLRVILTDSTPTVFLLLSYYAILLVVARRDAVIDYRILSPLYVPATFVILKLGADVLGSAKPPTGVFAGRIPTALLVLWLCMPIRDAVSATTFRFRNGAGGYSTAAVRQSGILTYIKQLVSTNHAIRIYSNDPRGLWELARINASYSPSTTGYSQYRLTAHRPEDLIGQWPPEGEAYLVWLNTTPTWLYSIDELRRVANVSEVAHFRDGYVYHLSVLHR